MPIVNVYYTLTKSASLNVIEAFKFQRKSVDPSTCNAGGCTGRMKESVVVSDKLHIELRLLGIKGSWTLKAEVVVVGDPSQKRYPLLVGTIESGDRKSINRAYIIKWS